MRPKTLNRGADDERAAIVRRIKKMLKLYPAPVPHGALEDLLGWGQKRHARVDKRKGGLGR